MGATASAVRIRHNLHSRLIDARARTDERISHRAGRCALRSSDREAPHYFLHWTRGSFRLDLLAHRAFFRNWFVPSHL